MIAQLTNINFNAVKTTPGGKKLTGVSFVVQPLPYKGKPKEPSEKFVFSNHAIAEQLKTLVIGDWVNLTFDDSPYKNPQNIEKTDAPVFDKPKEHSSSSGGGSSYGKNDTETQLRIARSVAIKEASSIVTALFQAGAYPKTKVKPEFLAQEVKNLAKEFEGYLNLSEDVAEIAADVSSIDREEDFDQVPFDE